MYRIHQTQRQVYHPFYLLINTLHPCLTIFSTLSFIFSFSASSSCATLEIASTLTREPNTWKIGALFLCITSYNSIHSHPWAKHLKYCLHGDCFHVLLLTIASNLNCEPNTWKIVIHGDCFHVLLLCHSTMHFINACNMNTCAYCVQSVFLCVMTFHTPVSCHLNSSHSKVGSTSMYVGMTLMGLQWTRTWNNLHLNLTATAGGDWGSKGSPGILRCQALIIIIF